MNKKSKHECKIAKHITYSNMWNQKLKFTKPFVDKKKKKNKIRLMN